MGLLVLGAALTSCAEKPAADSSAATATAKTTAVDDSIMPQASNFGLLTGQVNHLENDTIFRADSRVNMLTVLDFTAVWCGPCRTFKPVFDEAAQRYRDVMFVSVDVDQMPLTAHAFRIRSIPTLVFIKPDGTITTYVGLNEIYPAANLDAVITSQMTL